MLFGTGSFQAPKLPIPYTVSTVNPELLKPIRSDEALGKKGNVVLDPISHGTNVWPWVKLAAALGSEVRWLPVKETA